MDKARIIYPSGQTSYFDDQAAAYAVWLGLAPHVAAAFRGKGDTEPVYSWDFVKP